MPYISSPSGITSFEAASRLNLLGTVHGDSKGYPRAIRFFEQLQPDLILIEFSPFARLFRKRHLRSYQRTLAANIRKAAGQCGISFKEALRRPEIEAIRRQIAYPFEYRAAAVFANRTHTRLLLVDYSAFSMKWILTWPELISAENLANLLAETSRRISHKDTYGMAAGSIRDRSIHSASHLIHLGMKADPMWEVRERFMAKQIRRALAVFNPLRPVYIGGWQHLTKGGNIPTLRDLLGVEASRCRLLDGGL
ncbi:MAG: hypothetical protein AB2L11_02420 [Syntrophobacteraceae bacterium]